MQSKTRYSIIAAGFIVFFVLAPTIVFYVKGLTLNLTEVEPVQTGLLTTLSEPDSATVFLNGEDRGKTPANIRFLKPGEYAVKIQKPGFRPWEKKLVIREGKVTWAYSGVPTITLFKEQETPIALESSVNDALFREDDIWYVTPKFLVHASGDNFEQSETIVIPEDTYHFLSSPKTSAILLVGKKNVLRVNISTKTVTPLTVDPSSTIQVSDNGTIFVLAKNVLSVISPNGKQQTVIKPSVLAIQEHTEGLYMLTNETSGTALALMNPDNLQQAPQTIISNLPVLSSPKLFVTVNKSVLVQADSKLYSVGSTLALIATNVDSVWQPKSSDRFLYSTSSELYTFDVSNPRPVLVYRTSTGFGYSYLASNIGYAFTISGGLVKAIELDDRDRPNVYDFGTVDPSATFVLSPDLKKLLILSKNNLLVQTILDK